MTKKAMALKEKYIEKLEGQLWLYNRGLCDIAKASEWLRNEENDFMNLLTSMYRYSLLSESDYKELWNVMMEEYDIRNTELWGF